MYIIYPSEEQKKPSGAALIALSNRMADGSIDVVAGYVYASTAELGDKIAQYVDALVAGEVQPAKAAEAKAETAQSRDAEALMLSILGLPKGPWSCRGRCGKSLDWPGICPECYRETGIVDKRPFDALASIPMALRKCTFDNQEWQRGIKTDTMNAAMELAKRNVSIEITGDRGIQMGVAIFIERLKSTKNNNDARFLAARDLSVESIRQVREMPLVCLDTPDPRIATVLAKSTTVIACNCMRSGITEKLSVW